MEEHLASEGPRFNPGVFTGLVEDAIWAPMRIFSMLVPNNTGPYFNVPLPFPGACAGDLINRDHWLPLNFDENMSALVEGIEEGGDGFVGLLGLNSQEMETSPFSPPVAKGNVVAACVHYPVYRDFMLERNAASGLPVFLGSRQCQDWMNANSFVDSVFFCNAITSHGNSTRYEITLRDGAMVRVQQYDYGLRTLEPPWRIAVPSGPVPLSEWLRIHRFAHGPSSTDRAAEAFIRAVCGVSSEFRARRWNRYCVDIAKPMCHPKLGALSWELKNMKETNLPFDEGVMQGMWTPPDHHAKVAYHASQEGALGMIFGLGRVVRGTNGIGNPWSRVRVDADEIFGVFLSPYWNMVLSYAPIAENVQTFNWLTKIQFAFQCRVDRCKVLAGTDKGYYIAKEHWVTPVSLFVGVREAMLASWATGHIPLAEERVLTVELPVVARPQENFPFQRGWGLRPDNLIPLLDQALRLRPEAGVLSIQTTHHGGVILQQPQYVHQFGNSVVQICRFVEINGCPLRVGRIGPAEALPSGREGAVACFSFNDVITCLLAKYPKLSKDDVAVCWSRMRPAIVNMVIAWTTELARADLQHVLLEEQEVVLMRFCQAFVEQSPTSIHRDTLMAGVPTGPNVPLPENSAMWAPVNPPSVVVVPEVPVSVNTGSEASGSGGVALLAKGVVNVVDIPLAQNPNAMLSEQKEQDLAKIPDPVQRENKRQGWAGADSPRPKEDAMAPAVSAASPASGQVLGTASASSSVVPVLDSLGVDPPKASTTPPPAKVESVASKVPQEAPPSVDTSTPPSVVSGSAAPPVASGSKMEEFASCAGGTTPAQEGYDSPPPVNPWGNASSA